MFLRELVVMAGDSPSAENATETESVPIRFTVQDPNRKLLLTSTSSAERILWLRKLEEARKHCILTERAVMQRQRSSNSSFFLLQLIKYVLSSNIFLIDWPSRYYKIL